MGKMGLAGASSYVDGKIMHPECSSRKQYINLCRQDTLEEADLTIQGVLRANGVENAHTYTPFMDYRFARP
jgi:hypothetical protein